MYSEAQQRHRVILSFFLFSFKIIIIFFSERVKGSKIYLDLTQLLKFKSTLLKIENTLIVQLLKFKSTLLKIENTLIV